MKQVVLWSFFLWGVSGHATSLRLTDCQVTSRPSLWTPANLGSSWKCEDLDPYKRGLKITNVMLVAAGGISSCVAPFSIPVIIGLTAATGATAMASAMLEDIPCETAQERQAEKERKWKQMVCERALAEGWVCDPRAL